MKMFRFLLVGLFALAFAGSATAQSDPNLQNGQVPTAAQWNSFFRAKQDVLGYQPLGLTGGVLTGRLVTAPPGASTAGFNLSCGSVPASPTNGDLWCTSGGMFAQINGSTVAIIGGTGNVSGPSSSIDNALARFDGTTGKILQGSLVTISDIGAINAPQDLSTTIATITVGTGGSNNSQYPAFADIRSITGAGTSMHAFADNKNIDASGNFGMNSFDSRFNINGTQTYDHVQSFQAFVNFGSTGAIRAFTGYTFNPILSNGGHILTLTGINIGNPLGNTAGTIPYVGTIDAAYGIFVADYSAAGTFNRAIQTVGPSIAEFGGEVRSRATFLASAVNPVFRWNGVDPGTGGGPPPYANISHDGTDWTFAQTSAGAVFFNLSGVTALRIGGGFLDVFGSTSGRTRLQSAAVGGTSNLILPAVSDTLVARTTTDTLTNKTISGSSNTLSNIAIGTITGFGTGVATALAIAVNSAGSIIVNGGAAPVSSVTTAPNTFGGLPTCNTGAKGMRQFITDNAAAFAFTAAASSGGALQTPVYCDGATWRQGANDNLPADMIQKAG